MDSEWSGAHGVGKIVWHKREFDGVAARIWSNGDWQVHGSTADLAAARAVADRVLAIVRDDASLSQEPADPDTDPAMVSDLRTAAATLRSAGLTPDGAACVALVEAMRRGRVKAPAVVVTRKKKAVVMPFVRRGKNGFGEKTAAVLAYLMTVGASGATSSAIRDATGIRIARLLLKQVEKRREPPVVCDRTVRRNRWYLVEFAPPHLVQR